MRKKWVIPLLLSFAALGSAFAQQSEVWNLKDCIDYALTHSLKIQQNKASEQTAAIGVLQAKAGLLPSLNASMNQGVTYRPFQESGGNFVNGGIASNAADKATQSGGYGINASWTLWNGGKNRLNVQSSEARTADGIVHDDRHRQQHTGADCTIVCADSLYAGGPEGEYATAEAGFNRVCPWRTDGQGKTDVQGRLSAAGSANEQWEV